MKNRIDTITFPTEPSAITRKNEAKWHTEYGQYHYYKSFWKFATLYKLLSSEKDISDDILISRLGECMRINGNYDCRITIDKKRRYRDLGFSAKTYTGLIHLIAGKIKEWKVSHKNGYYILCRIADDADSRWQTQTKVQALIQ